MQVASDNIGGATCVDREGALRCLGINPSVATVMDFSNAHQLGWGVFTVTRNRALRHVLAGVALLLSTNTALPQSAADLMQRTRDAYHKLQSYSDTGEVVTDYQGIGTSVLSRTKGSFQTTYEAPRHFRLKFRKENGEELAIWTKGQERTVYSWWSATRVADSSPSVVPFMTAASPTLGSTTLIPTLLFPQAKFNAQLDQLADPKRDADETVDGHACYRIRGDERASKGSMVRPLVVWIDRESLLVRRVAEETPESMGKGAVSRTTWTIHPQANPKLSEGDFGFTPPK
jgi:hypothetical protein